MFGEGSPTAKLVFVGEGPGADEDASGRPFVGRSGDLLTKMIHAMGLTARAGVHREHGQMSPARKPHTVHGRNERVLGIPDETTPDHPPGGDRDAREPGYEGDVTNETGITQLRGQWQRLPGLAGGLEGIAVMPTFHPAFVLRRYTPEIRGKAWSDLQQVMTKLGLSLPKQ